MTSAFARAKRGLFEFARVRAYLKSE